MTLAEAQTAVPIIDCAPFTSGRPRARRADAARELNRVVNPPQVEAHKSRLSMPFFLQPNVDAVVECIPSFCGENRPPRYAPVTSREWATRVTRPLDPEAEPTIGLEVLTE